VASEYLELLEIYGIEPHNGDIDELMDAMERDGLYDDIDIYEED